MLSPATTLQGRYRVEEEIGRGGMGAVYRAVDLRFANTVALKQMTVEGSMVRAAFEREARLLNGLRHRALPVVMDYFSEGADCYLVMQFIPGEDLGQLLVRNGRGFPPETVAAWADQLLGALEYLHSRVPPVVHRDIKPQNLKLTPEGEIILLDFGLAKGLTSQTSTARSLVGFTASYAPLEQMRGEGTDPSGDVYAASATLYHLLTAVLPPDAVRRAEASVAGEPDPLVQARVLNATVPPALSELLARGMAMSSRRRPGAAAMREGLRAAMASTMVGIASGSAEASGDLHEATTAKRETHEDATLPLETDDAKTTVESDTVPNNLPHAMTTFVGRERELADVTRSLESVRLVTLAGTGGIGKTRLALEVAAGALSAFPDGVWFVDLAAVHDTEAVPRAVAAACGVREEPGEPLAVTLARTLGDKRALLVVDNCEQVVAASSDLVARLLRSCPRLKALATSREALGVEGEQTWTLDALAVPPEKLEGAVGDYESVALFCDRAALAKPGFELTSENDAVVAEICRRLEGLPLAIELAAARIKTIPVEQIRAKLGDRLGFLTRGARTAAPRHQTLRAAIDWSHELLTDGERAVFRRLAVFGDGWTLDAAEAVCAGGPVEPGVVADLVEHLIDKSLVTVGDGASGPRYRMLESIHQYASEKLADSGEDGDVRRRHRDWFAALAERGGREMDGDHMGEWVAKLDAERLNLMAALLWSRAEDDQDVVFGMVRNLSFYWYLRGYWSERVWLERLRAREDLPAEFRIVIASWLGGFAYLTGDYATAEALERECLDARRATGDVCGAAFTLSRLGGIAHIQGDYATARAHYEESLALNREIENPRGIALALLNLASIEIDEGNFDGAEALVDESARGRRVPDESFDVMIAPDLYRADIARARGDLARAHALCLEYVARVRERGFKHSLGNALSRLGDVERDAGRTGDAVAHYLEAIVLNDELGDRVNLAWGLAGLAMAASALGNAEQALRFAGAAHAIRVKCNYHLSKRDGEELERWLAPARAALGAEAAERAFDEGAAMTTAEARAVAERLRAAASKGA